MTPEIMIDIETLNNEFNSAIVTIGAHAFSFDHEETRDFYININPRDLDNYSYLALSKRVGTDGNDDAFVTLGADTVVWWMQQSPQARESLLSKEAVTLKTAMTKFAQFVSECRASIPSAKKELNIWANDPNFDCVICENSFRAAKVTCPWNFWEQRSCRTMEYLGRKLGIDRRTDFPREGTYHNAIDDCKYQVSYVKAIHNALLEPHK